VGIAIYNSIILDLHFPLVVYKKLMGVKTSMHDLRAFQPTIAKSLDSILTHQGDVAVSPFRVSRIGKWDRVCRSSPCRTCA
jgi:hypothetical protein